MTLMAPWKKETLLKATGGKFLFGDGNRTFDGIRIDSRHISPGDLFVAIRGESHDGHGFINDVLDKGVRGVVLAIGSMADLSYSHWEKMGVTAIAVSDTTTALGDLAAFRRRQSGVRVVAITGSNGKTTTRGMTAMVVGQRYSTLQPQGNFNNQIGLPLTLLRLKPDHEWAVLELGMNHPGEISRLASICEPDIGVITNIGPAHLEGVGSMEGVMHAKGELLAHIKSSGCAILNNDDPRVRMLADSYRGARMLFGHAGDVSVTASDIEEKPEGVSFLLGHGAKSITLDLQTPGRFMVANALAAAAVGCGIGLSLNDIKRGLEAFRPVPGRLVHNLIGRDINLIDDTYNANPGSMKAAIDTLTAVKGDSRTIAVVGDMLELGDHAERLHREVGDYIAKSGINRLYATGEFSQTVAAGAQAAGMDRQTIFIGTHEEIVEDLALRLLSGNWILVKGSRGMVMEKVIEGLKERLKGPGSGTANATVASPAQ